MTYLPALLFVLLAGPPTAKVVWDCYKDIRHDLRKLRRLRRMQRAVGGIK